MDREKASGVCHCLLQVWSGKEIPAVREGEDLAVVKDTFRESLNRIERRSKQSKPPSVRAYEMLAIPTAAASRARRHGTNLVVLDPDTEANAALEATIKGRAHEFTIAKLFRMN